MTASRDRATQAVLDKLLADNGLGPETRLFREAMRDTLTPTGAPGSYRLSANASPSEAVIDIYGQGYLVQADQLGAGCAFAESAAPNWQETMEMRALREPSSSEAPSLDRLGVTVRLGDILEQGGLLYPVESVTVERAWYCTLPAGSVRVLEVR